MHDLACGATFGSATRWFAFTLLLAAAPGCKPGDTERRTDQGAGRIWAEPSTRSLPPAPGGGGGEPAELEATLPSASENYVFVANAKGRSVVAIDSQELTIRSIETGNAPSRLETVPGQDAAIVLNFGSGDASVVRAGSGGALSQQRLSIVEGANTVEVAPDGDHAVIYYDADQEIAGGDFGDFQSVSVITLASDGSRETRMSVGFKPERVVFREDGGRAFVVTQQGISVLDFEEIDTAGAGIAPSMAFGRQVPDRDGIIITPDGRHALAHPPGSDELRMLDLESGQEVVRYLWSLFPAGRSEWEAFLAGLDPEAALPDDLPWWYEPPSFRGLTYDPIGAQLHMVEATTRSVIRVPIPDGVTGQAPILVQEVLHDVREATPLPGSDRVVAYRAGAGVTVLTAIDFSRVPAAGAGEDAGIGEPPTEEYELRKAVFDVLASPDGETVVVLHTRDAPGDPNQPGITLEERVARSPGYSLLRPTTGEVKLERTDAVVDAVVFADTGSHALLLLDDPEPQFPTGERPFVRELQRIELARFLASPPIQLDSPPVFGGTVPGSTRAFVAQDHPDGRLTFVDWISGAVQTVTGFEINSRIQN